MNWLTKERAKKPVEFKRAATGGFIAYCSKCGKQEFPKDEWQLKQGSSCCKVEYQNERIKVTQHQTTSFTDPPF